MRRWRRRRERHHAGRRCATAAGDGVTGFATYVPASERGRRPHARDVSSSARRRAVKGSVSVDPSHEDTKSRNARRPASSRSPPLRRDVAKRQVAASQVSGGLITGGMVALWRLGKNGGRMNVSGSALPFEVFWRLRLSDGTEVRSGGGEEAAGLRVRAEAGRRPDGTIVCGPLRIDGPRAAEVEEVLWPCAAVPCARGARFLFCGGVLWLLRHGRWSPPVGPAVAGRPTLALGEALGGAFPGRLRRRSRARGRLGDAASGILPARTWALRPATDTPLCDTMSQKC